MGLLKKKVLILGVASVQMDAIKELKKMGYEVHAVAMANDGPGAAEADVFKEINILDKEAITAYIKEEGISVVYSVGSDMAIPVASDLSEKLDLPRFVSEKTAKICNNKDLMRETLGNNFEGNIPFQIMKEKDEEIQLPYPFILKPTDSQGQRGVVLVNNKQEFLEHFDHSKSYSRSGVVIIEKYVTGPEISVNGYMVDGKLVFLVPSDRETWTQFTGLIHKHILPTRVLSDEGNEGLLSILESTCSKLEINNGPVYAQMKVENGLPYIIEITPRLDGCHMWNILEKYTGVNLLELSFEHLIEGTTNALDNAKEITDDYVLEFICQEPNTPADYSDFQDKMSNSIESFQYYEQGDNIRPVNGKYEKIGYFIYKTDK